MQSHEDDYRSTIELAPPFSQSIHQTQSADDVSLSALLSVLKEYKRRLFLSVVAAIAIATPVVFLIPVEYKAESVILTPQQAQPSLAALAQLTGIGSASSPALSLLSGFGVRNPTDLYIGILKSRTVADGLIQTFHLQQVYRDRYLYQARKHLARHTSIETTKDTLIHIRVEDRDARRAAELANAYVEQLSKQDSRFALTEASQRRLFFEGELAREKDSLATAEIALRNTEQTTGLVVPAGQAEALIRSGAQLRIEILSREAQVEAMETYASDDNPRLRVVKRELGALQAELNKVERGNGNRSALSLATGQLPEAGLEYMRKLRDMKYHETLFEVLAKQYEAARLDEAKAAPATQVVDRAVVPEKRSWPPRTILISAAMLLAFSVCSLHILVARNFGKNPG